MAGIVAQMPTFVGQLFEGGRSGSIGPFTIIGMVVLLLGLIVFIAFMERATRRLLIQYPKRASANGMMQADRSHLSSSCSDGSARLKAASLRQFSAAELVTGLASKNQASTTAMLRAQSG